MARVRLTISYGLIVCPYTLPSSLAVLVSYLVRYEKDPRHPLRLLLLEAVSAYKGTWGLTQPTGPLAATFGTPLSHCSRVCPFCGTTAYSRFAVCEDDR